MSLLGQKGLIINNFKNEENLAISRDSNPPIFTGILPFW